MGQELKSSARFNNIDMVVPVPLHPKKHRQRGYNQVTEFGREIAKHINAQYSETILVNTKYTGTQTRKNRISRNDFQDNNFKTNP
ncbi:ComF family protein [Galbibacter pacificus]|uniref:Uncharacterized protein n=1 Tax=Galbibacter pacificus TaxID=2996052 RepID=A0ABT6FTL4_9FLAO|nr:hypothetical protein [Galbibacter pacificus]MDG3583123.1 hypothetical protein [Galbibacter pacificus]MDG3586604.1 hypothetical protein [Galbibacter pacificus]